MFFEDLDEVSSILKTAVKSNAFNGCVRETQHGLGMGDTHGCQVVSDSCAIYFFIFSGEMELANIESGR